MVVTRNRNNVIRLVPPPADTGRLLAESLVDLYKAVKAATFYPDGHPYRTAPLERAYHTLARLAEKREVALSVGRRGFNPLPDGAGENLMVQELAREFLVRGVAGVTFTENLLRRDLKLLVDLMGRDPRSGRLTRQLQENDVTTISVRGRERSTIWSRRNDFGDDLEEGDAPEPGELSSGASSVVTTEPESIAEVLHYMAVEGSDSAFQELGRELVERFPRERGDFAVLPVLEELLRQHQDPAKSLPQREYALFTLERLTDATEELLLNSLEERGCPDREGVLRVLAALGGKGAYPVIQRLCLAQGVAERKSLAAALVRLGPAAVPPVMAMLRDERWYVVRNMVSILGEIHAAQAIPEISKTARHPDRRVRKEAVRALMKIAGAPAEAVLVALVEDADETIARHAILSLGLMRSRLAVQPLLKLLERRDILLKKAGLKKEVALALGRIGDRRATAPLLKLLAPTPWPVLGRWLELRVVAASALGSLGDDAALPALNRLAAGPGPLAEACREAAETIESV